MLVTLQIIHIGRSQFLQKTISVCCPWHFLEMQLELHGVMKDFVPNRIKPSLECFLAILLYFNPKPNDAKYVDSKRCV